MTDVPSTAASAVPPTNRQQHARSLTIQGVLIMVLGFIAIVLPVIATLAVTLLLGALLLVFGIVELVRAIRAWRRVSGGWHEGLGWALLQAVAASLRKGVPVGVYSDGDGKRVAASILAIDSRVDSNTRNTVIRARIADATQAPSPGASVRVDVPVGAAQKVVVIPASALRKGPGGDHVFVLTEDEAGKTRAHLRTVTVEALRGDEVVLSSGVNAGERVAASGAFKLREAALVVVTKPAVPAVAQVVVPAGGAAGGE
jgi:hypothetical protein